MRIATDSWVATGRVPADTTVQNNIAGVASAKGAEARRPDRGPRLTTSVSSDPLASTTKPSGSTLGLLFCEIVFRFDEPRRDLSA